MANEEDHLLAAAGCCIIISKEWQCMKNVIVVVFGYIQSSKHAVSKEIMHM